MFLKNYTSSVPVSETIHRIERVLIKCGVSGITKEYGPEGNVVAVRFEIVVPETPKVSVRLPVDVDRALDALWLDYADGEKLTPDGQRLQHGSRKTKRRADFIDQAQRTAWRIVQDWVEVQLSMIQMRQADFVEVFLPYVWDGRDTVYSRLKSTGFRALLPENSSP